MPNAESYRRARMVKKVVFKKKRRVSKKKIALRRMPRSVLPEIKKFDYSEYLQEVGTRTGVIFQTSAFTEIPQGDTVSTRTGQAIYVKYIVVDFLLTASNTASWNSTRVAFHIDRQPVASTYAAGVAWTVLYSATSQLLTDTLAFPNTTQTGRFKCVKNFYFVRSPHLIDVSGGPDPTPITSDTANAPVHKRVKIPINRIIRFQNGSNEVGGGVKLWLTAWSNQDGAAAPTISFTARTYFTDA